MAKGKYTELGKRVLIALGELLSEGEPDFSDTTVEDIAKHTGLAANQIKGVLPNLYELRLADHYDTKENECNLEHGEDFIFIHLTGDGWKKIRPLITTEEIQKISAIANRTIELLEEHIDQDKMSWMMDFEKVHESIGLKLDELLNADNSNFIHDAVGIYNHLNRETGELEDCFLPRFAK